MSKKFVSLLLIFIWQWLQIESNDGGSRWYNHGGDLENHRHAQDQEINVLTVERLTLRWRYPAGANISSTPAIYDCVVYATSSNGLVFAVSVTGIPLWRVSLPQITGFSGTMATATPTVTEELVIVGLVGPACVVALNRRNGHLAWISPELDSHPLSQITMSGTAYQGAFYIGVSSREELTQGECCTFQGSFHKLDLRTGRKIWTTFMIPNGYTGAPVWGSSPSIDTRRNLIFVATGNLYTVPEDVQNCLDSNGNATDCLIPDSTVCGDAVVAMNLWDGSLKWCSRLGGNDAWRLACATKTPTPPNCPNSADHPGLQYDFGEAPMLVTTQNEYHEYHDIVVTGQKTGIVWVHDRDTGRILRETVAGPGGPLGGAISGAATDNHRIYTNIANTMTFPFQITPAKDPEYTTGGGWVAIDALSAKILWTTPNPTESSNPTGGQGAYGPVTLSKDVLLVGSFDPDGYVYGLSAYDGRVLWEHKTGARVYGGFSVGHSCAFVGSGYSLFAFCVGPPKCF